MTSAIPHKQPNLVNLYLIYVWSTDHFIVKRWTSDQNNTILILDETIEDNLSYFAWSLLCNCSTYFIYKTLTSTKIGCKTAVICHGLLLERQRVKHFNHSSNFFFILYTFWYVSICILYWYIFWSAFPLKELFCIRMSGSLQY